MTVTQSTRRAPAKPYPAFPLWAHANGQWAKRIKGKVYFFGVWNDPQAAVDSYMEQVHDLQAGRKPRPQGQPDADALTIKQAINVYLNWAKAEFERGEISPEHYADLKRTWVNRVPKIWDINRQVVDLKPDDFRELRQRFGRKVDGSAAAPDTMLGHIRRVKSMFSWLLDEHAIDRLPAYGSGLSKLSKKQVAERKNAADDKIFTRTEIRALLAEASYRLEAMILLGLDCAMGPRDIALLEFDQLDLVGGWLDGKRSKTAVRRCAKLWPETVASLRTVIAKRFEPEDKAHKDLVFITVKRRPFLNKGAISRIFGKLKIKAEINGTNRGFYVLRHVFRDVANQQPDDNASRWITGHKRSTIDDAYTRSAPRDRIEKVCDYVRRWLFEGVAE